MGFWENQPYFFQPTKCSHCKYLRSMSNSINMETIYSFQIHKPLHSSSNSRQFTLLGMVKFCFFTILLLKMNLHIGILALEVYTYFIYHFACFSYIRLKRYFSFKKVVVSGHLSWENFIARYEVQGTNTALLFPPL